MPPKPSSRKASAASSSAFKSTRTPSTSKSKDPKQSHLYTDDNPATTLHGTGFKDAATARQTLSLISNRSLIYQWQVVNTMYHRAKSHPAMRKAASKSSEASSGPTGMQDAMAIFRIWLDETYPQARDERVAQGRDFKPLLSKATVQKYLDRIITLQSTPKAAKATSKAKSKSAEPDDDDLDACKSFAKMYVDLPKGKKLANVLVDETHPEREDWEIRRERALMKLTASRDNDDENDLWDEEGGVSEWHLMCIGWAWSPAGERKLPA